MQRLITGIFALFLLLCTTSLNAQNVTVSGKVTDTNNEPLIGVSVQVRGTTVGVITDFDGNYTLQVPNAQAVLRFSYVGFLSQDITVGSQKTINVALKDDTQNLEEVVVVGYGTQKKMSVTGSVASISGIELKSSPTTNLTNAMVGRMPGVIGWQRSDEPGGGSTTIRIRGTNTLGNKDPLVVIDGVADRGGGLNRLNPTEIESMSVLKDAAAAIYGARAANGVILVTTKRGKDGAPVINFSGSYGFSQPTRLPEMANAFEYATMLNEINPGTYTDEQLQKFKDGSDPWGYPNTNWFDAVIKPVSPLYRADLGISGGSDKMKYYFNVAANGEDGVYKRSANRYDQYSVRGNFDWKIGKYVTFQAGSTVRMEYKQYPAKSAGDIFSALRRGKPIYNAIWPTGEPGPDIEYGDNPVETASDGAGFDQQKTYHVQNNGTLNINIPYIDGLKITANGSYDKRFYSRKLFQKPVILYSWDGITRGSEGLSPAKRWISDPRMTREMEDQTDWMLNAILSYDKTFGLHTVNVTAGIEGQSKGQDYLRAYRRYYLSDAITEINLGSMQDQSNNGTSWQETRLNYFGRAAYNYMERYLIEFVWRYDGSYRFPTEKRYGFFPGIMAAWRASEENFWKENLSFIEYFKLRGSVSQTGSDVLVDGDGNVDRSIQYLATFGKEDNGYIIDGKEEPRFYLSRTPNMNITWEVGTTYNVGLDFKFLDSRLSWESDLFYHKRTHMLISRNASVPEISGISLPRENLGEMENKGFESLISWSDKAGEVNYTLSYNMTYAQNKILYWDETPGAPEWQQSTGHRANTSLYYKSDGIYHTQKEIDDTPHWSGAVPGDVKYVDVNNDGKIDADDRVRSSKNAEPPFIGGFNINLSWKGWDLMTLFQGAAGAETFIRTWSGTVGNFLKDYYDNRWTPENPNAKGPRTYERENQYWANPSNASDFFLIPSDYLRLKNVEIGYNVPAKFLKGSGVSNLRIYANAQNVFILDKVKVVDPETDNRDLTSYPQRKYYNFGVSITF